MRAPTDAATLRRLGRELRTPRAGPMANWLAVVQAGAHDRDAFRLGRKPNRVVVSCTTSGTVPGPGLIKIIIDHLVVNWAAP